MTIQEIEKIINQFNRSSECIKLSIRRSRIKKPVYCNYITEFLSEHKSVKAKKALCRILYERGYQNIEISKIIGKPTQAAHYYTKFYNPDNFEEKTLYLQIKNKFDNGNNTM